MKRPTQEQARETQASGKLPELVVIVPVFNEEECIRRVLAEWRQALLDLGVDFLIAVYDDGSQDRTADILRELEQGEDRIDVDRHANRGHGPTLLRAYAEASSPWVLQIDGDGELPASHFRSLWRQRQSFDLIVGSREGRVSTPMRRVVTAATVLVTKWLFGSSMTDPNSPYRLMRNGWLQEALSCMPKAAFAPNVLLSGIAAKGRARVCEIPIPYRGRQEGAGGFDLLRLAQGVVRSFADAVVTASALRRGRHP